MIITWEFPTRNEALIEDFSLMRSTGLDFDQLASVEPNKRFFIDSDFKEGITYSYKILARSHKGILSRDSAVISFTPSRQPDPPRNVTVKVSDNSVTLAWESEGTDIVYNLYKSFNKGVYGIIPVNKTPISGNSFGDSLSLGKPSFYTIRSLWRKEIRDEGYPSQEIVVDPFEFIPSAPKGLRFFVSPDRIYLYWDESEEAWVTGYKIYRRLGINEYVFIGETQIPSYVDRGTPSLTSHYRVSAVGPLKEGPGTEVQVIIFDETNKHRPDFRK